MQLLSEAAASNSGGSSTGRRAVLHWVCAQLARDQAPYRLQLLGP